MDTRTGTRVRTFNRFNLPGPSRPAESVPLAAGQRGTFSHSYDLGELVQGEHFILNGDKSQDCLIYIKTPGRPESYTRSGFALRVLSPPTHDSAAYEIIISPSVPIL